MTEAMPFLQKTILLSYDPRPFRAVFVFNLSASHFLDSFPNRGASAERDISTQKQAAPWKGGESGAACV